MSVDRTKDSEKPSLVLAEVGLTDNEALKALQAENWSPAAIVTARDSPGILLSKEFSSEADATRAAKEIDSRAESTTVLGAATVQAMRQDTVPFSGAINQIGSLAGLFPQTPDGLLAQAKYLTSVAGVAHQIEQYVEAWKRMVYVGAVCLMGAVAGALIIVWMALTSDKVETLSGWELCILVFVLAVFAASPAAILLLGKPLAGIDRWAPDPSSEPANDNDQTPTA